MAHVSIVSNNEDTNWDRTVIIVSRVPCVDEWLDIPTYGTYKVVKVTHYLNSGVDAGIVLDN